MKRKITWHDKAVPLAGIVFTLMLGAVMFYVGCQALETERGRLRTAADTYAAVTESLADAWEAGKLDRDQKRAVLRWTGRAHEALQEWRRRLRASGEAEGPREECMRAIGILNQIWMEVQDGSKPEKKEPG